MQLLLILHFAPYPITLVLGKKDPVLPYAENIEQIKDTAVKLITLNDGHMSHIENKKEVEQLVLSFLKEL